MLSVCMLSHVKFWSWWPICTTFFYQNYATVGNLFNATLYIIPYSEEGANFWGQSDSYSSCKYVWQEALQN